MNVNEIVWLVVGTAAGHLLGALATVKEYVTPTTTGDWDAAVQEELVVPVKKRRGPVPATTTEACVYCGRHYKNVSQHIRLSHPTKHQPRKRTART